MQGISHLYHDRSPAA